VGREVVNEMKLLHCQEIVTVLHYTSMARGQGVQVSGHCQVILMAALLIHTPASLA